MRFSVPRLVSSMLRQNQHWRRQAEEMIRTSLEPAGPVQTTRKPRPAATKLQEVHAFGRNPGNLRMLEYAPPGMPAGAPLVVVLHGCLQLAEDFDRAAGWTQLAREGGFAVLYPQQKTANNPNSCFNWFRPSAASRDRGEILSIRQMIDSMQRRHRLAPGRLHVFGLSAGGAMAAALMASYPDAIEGGAIIAGLPFGAARDAMGALTAMKSGVDREPAAWGDLVRKNAPDAHRWPSVSIWHGRSDHVVSVANAEALAAQWRDVHGLDAVPTQEGTIGNRLVRRWLAEDGEVAVEQHLISSMAHGLPVAAARLSRAAEKRFYLDVGVCTATEMARAWRLVPREASASRNASSR
ncbi:PHB depolymerase family esterase [Pseudomonas sp. R2.Fl]|nr:PHB depolymerase family esterase [Pseudomonas sp. R2.Fl]